MAVAGLHNISSFSPSLFGESQPHVSRRWGDERGNRSTRASTLLQMWRELEGEHVVSESNRSRQGENGLNSECLSNSGHGSDNGDNISQVSDGFENQHFVGSEMEHEDNNSIISEQSSDLGEIERERVRQIFREWMNTGSKGHSTCGFDLNRRSGRWLGENECERVRIIREWVQMTSQQRNNCGSNRDGVIEVGSQIEQVLDGSVISHPEIAARRPIRRICGRQTLLDLLLRAQNERKEELLHLSEQRPVSDFAHRIRIQALLRGRFLRNERLVLDDKPSSTAATELDLLRQRQTVSDLREEFLSKLDNSASTSANNTEFDSPLTVESNVESEFACKEREVADIHSASDLVSAADGNRSQQELEVQVTETENPVLDNEGSHQEVSLRVQVAIYREEPTLDTEERHEEIFTDVDEYSRLVEQSTDGSEGIHSSDPFEIHNANDEQRSYVHEEDGQTTDLEGNTNEEFDSQYTPAQLQEMQGPVIEVEDNAWLQLDAVAFTEWTDGREEVDISLQAGSANHWSLETSYNNAEGQDQMQESHDVWPNHDLQEAIDSWLDLPSREAGMSVRRIDTYDVPDDDNVHSMELRELFSRRRVSSLLHSGFRESLDQVLQSHVERLAHVFGDWELDDTPSSPALFGQDQEQLSSDQPSALPDGSERNPFVPSSTFFTASQPLWDEELQSVNWPRHLPDQQLGTEWEVINELRIDMARLQQRMNNMQSMLEACMDMQIELQRSVRQEVSAALNRTIFSRDATPDIRPNDESEWDHVRKGVCCLCQDRRIDSLLYRCGHMCSCSKCAEILVQNKGKCPMCQAPVVEVVRAYFVQ